MRTATESMPGPWSSEPSQHARHDAMPEVQPNFTQSGWVPRPAVLLESVAWLAMAAATSIAVGVTTTASGLVWANVVLSLLALLYGVRVFVGHGYRVTALGLFNLSAAMFIGYGGYKAATNAYSEVEPRYLNTALLGALAVQITVSAISWSTVPNRLVVPLVSARDGRWAVRLGVGGLLALYLVPRAFDFNGGALVEGSAFTCVMFVTIGVIFRERGRLMHPRNLLVLAALGVYAEFFHGGTGRLRLVAAACGVVILVTARYPLKRLKWGMVLGAPLALYFLAQERLALQESIKAGASAGRTGLESMLSPILLYAQIFQWEAKGDLALAWGKSLTTFPFIVLPNSMNPKWVPDAIGYDLVRFVAPARYGRGYSVAPTVFGEWVYNFAIWGLVLLVPLAVFALRILDRRLDAALLGLASGRNGIVKLAFWTMLCGSIADLVWGGLHIWFARTLARSPALVVAWALKGPSPRTGQDTRAQDDSRDASADRRHPTSVP